MTTPKPRYSGNQLGPMLAEFSDDLREKLSDFYPGKEEKADDHFGHPREAFVEEILAEAWWAKSELHWQQYEGTKAELRAEQQDLLKRITELEERLRKISPNLDRLLGETADPIDCADRLTALATHFVTAAEAIDLLPRASRIDEIQQWIAVELAVRVLPVLKKYGIKPSATGDRTFGYASDAIQVLKLIGDDLRLILSEVTWRDILLKAQATEPDLKK